RSCRSPGPPYRSRGLPVHCSALGGRALGPPRNGTCVRSLHRSDSPSGSRLDQVSRFAGNPPSDAITTPGACRRAKTNGCGQFVRSPVPPPRALPSQVPPVALRPPAGGGPSPRPRGQGRMRSAWARDLRATRSASSFVASGPATVIVAREWRPRKTTYQVRVRESPLMVATPTVREPSPMSPFGDSTTRCRDHREPTLVRNRRHPAGTRALTCFSASATDIPISVSVTVWPFLANVTRAAGTSPGTVPPGPPVPQRGLSSTTWRWSLAAFWMALRVPYEPESGSPAFR